MTGPLYAVIGGANMDVIAVPARRVLPGDSAPGRIDFLPGGVGRNIAHALKLTAAADCLVELVTALGGDDRSRFVREETEKAGVSLEYSLTFPDRSCPAYAAIMDGGDLLSGVNDMALLKELTPEALAPSKELLARADMIILDANLEQGTLEWVAESFPSTPLFAETVSAVKCTRFKPILSRLFGIKPNRKEAQELTGMEIRTAEDALEGAARLHKKGVGHVIITLGKDGSVYYSSRGYGIIEAPSPGDIRNINGAGDYYLAGVLPALQEGLSLKEAARAGSMNAWKKLKGEL